MASKAKSRWADTAEDAKLDARLKQEKEEKRRKKAERARRIEADKQTALASSSRGAESGRGDDDDAGRPSKRRRLTPEAQARETVAAQGTATSNGNDPTPVKLLRFEDTRTWGKSRSVDNYDKLNDIEEGTYGWVARGAERATGKIVALKRLKLEPSDRNGLPVTGLREIQILQDCKHRNVVRLEEVVVGEDTSKLDNSIFLVLEFVEHDLKGILQDMPEPFLSSEVKRLLLQLTSGVSYLHENWILHRDLKTSNLLLNNRGLLKIADFGMARYVGDPPPRLTQLVVTLWYRAPELLLGTKTYDAAVDMWSVGCIFGELITCEPLLQGSNEVDQMSKIFELCGVPTEESWPGFRTLPNARSLQLPKNALTTGSVVRARFPSMTAAGASLLNDLLALNPGRRPSASEMLDHEYFRQDPKPKPESMFPTFPSKAGQERRRRHEPNAPVRGQAVALGDVDLSGIFQGRDKEARGAGFTLRMV
ncbi:cyclin-dependent kinase G-1 [Metarhizium album ARSEF 1941]|uniref:cyclin-dependent kinase n=1 Tax=Metarhizium album (strain ARSEF 1941) TaxID=1081103 RepID=A0A0B2X540_METAS|nr:cyclin-dependent kinase G-1 [Metarhizium album ARSEF 1941]KHO00853.1 cyclin-dependent kinase G-1 [Metarhizium album ARSEF 1941]